MGRSRFHSADEDPTQRSRRKKNTSSGENLESSSAGQGTSDGKALYHCNYCNKDITGKVRIKCCVCPDFDLCIECFSVGAEVVPHKSNHSYRVMDNLSFPLICPDWNADDEILLLEGIEMYGLGNWAEVAEHVGTKSKEQCINHYKDVYMSSPFFPLPDMSHVVGKNRKELLAMAKGLSDDKKEFNMTAESLFSPSRIKTEDSLKESVVGRNSSNNVNKKPPKLEDSQPERPFKGKKPVPSNDGPSLVELSGYNAKRREFDPEYDNDAEQLLSDMDFKETDTEEEHELKLRILRIYSKRLDERKRRKDFVLERNLLYPNPFEKDLLPEERAMCRRFDVFMKFHSKEDHEDLLHTVVSEHRALKRIQELKEAQAGGCRTSSEAERYIGQKRKKEAEDNNALRFKDSNSRPAPISSSVAVMDLMGFNGADLLSEAEKRVCGEIRLAPPIYLKMQEIMSVQIFSGNVTKKSDAHHLFKMEPSRIDRVYDMLVKKGVAQP